MTGPDRAWAPAPLRLLAEGHADLAPSRDRRVAIDQLLGASTGSSERAVVERIVDLVDRHPEIALRTCRPGHLTGSALVVDHTGSRTLLMLHTKLGRWLQPGGHADGDTNLAGVALREATEETGIVGLRVATPAIDVDIHEVAPPGEDPHLHLDLRYLVMAPRGAVEVGNEESRALAWIDPTDASGLEPPLDAGTLRLMATGLSAARRLVADRSV